MKMIAHLEFHPIGQGCFYTGLLKINDSKKISFVYDCGTNSAMNYLDSEIDTFRADVGSVLDLLIISHFDADHVNGVVKLLRGIRCNRLIIPYYNPIERLLLYTTSAYEDDDYRRMLQDPIGFFGGNDNKFNIGEIVVIGGPQQGGETENVASPSSGGGDGINSEELLKDEVKFNDIGIEVESTEILDKDNDNVSRSSLKTKLLFFRLPYKLRIGNVIWEYVFYLKKMDNVILMRDFTNDVNTLLKEKKTSVFDLFEEDYISELKDRYRKYYGQNLNATSLVAYHGPLITPNVTHLFNKKCVCDLDCDCYYHHRHRDHNAYWGTLLTGDIDIKAKWKADALVSYFNGYLNKVCVFQVPHHGAKANWPIVPIGYELHNFCYYVINHGIGRKHHPGIDVVADIGEKRGLEKIHLNNEVYRFGYRMYW